MVLWGYSSTRRIGVWQIAEAVTAEGSNIPQSVWIAVVKFWIDNYRQVVGIKRDPGSGNETIDSIWISHGLNIDPVAKGPGSKIGRVERMKDLLATGQARIIKGSELENDLRS